jgi:NAD(P)-dependent dehydrogenase (short-subunit alcohol dehydrogenase family)
MEKSERRWVLVTGASSGIGEAVCKTLSAAEFGVIAAARHVAASASAATPGHGPIVPLALDISDAEEVGTVPATARRIAGGALYALVNNAGVAVPGAFELSSLDDARRQIETNVIGTLNLTHALLPSIRAARGRLVVVTSVVGRLEMPFNAVHCGTKHFLEGFFDSLRVELRQAGVTTVIVEPGTIRTPMVEKFSAAAERALAAVPPELDDLYGRPVRSMVRSMQSHIRTGSPPAVVAEAVLRALTEAHPPLRLAIGRHARRMTLLAKYLPDSAKDALLVRFLDL